MREREKDIKTIQSKRLKESLFFLNKIHFLASKFLFLIAVMDNNINTNTAIDGATLDSEFELDVVMAYELMKKMKLSEDRRVCARYLTQCHKMKSENIDIKFHRNRFFRYLLKAMRQTVNTTQKDYYVNLVSIFSENNNYLNSFVFMHSLKESISRNPKIMK